jgi:membrane protein DedA with SNARE-associated domain
LDISITDWATEVMQRLGYAGIAGLTALENIVPPIPSEVILPLAGFEAGRGTFSLPLVVLAATLGSMLGALVLYMVGSVFGEQRLRYFIERYGRYALIETNDLDVSLRWFEMHGGKAVLIGRLVPAVRSLVSIPAGMSSMSMPRFLVLTAIGSGVWNTLLVGLGYILGEQWHRVEEYSKPIEYGVLAVLLAIGIIWFARRLRRVLNDRRTGASQPDAGP